MKKSLKVAMLQMNPIVGDCVGNTDKYIRAYREACEAGAELVVASELALIGYPPQDLLLRESFLDLHDQELARLVASVGNVGLVVGVVERNTRAGKPLWNSAVLIQNGKSVETQRKTHLPNYDVFDERRYFESNREEIQVFVYKGVTMAMLVCEDIWGTSEDNPNGIKLYERDLIAELAEQDLDVLITVNASPYYHRKGDVRLKLVSGIARKLHTSVVYVNQVGGNDGLVFDGRSFAVNERGECIASVAPFSAGVAVVVVGGDATGEYPSDAGISDLYNALVLGLRDYVHKSGRHDVVLGISGGIDSALVAAIAVDALGREHVYGVAMPSKFSSRGSISDALDLANNLGIRRRVIPINAAYDAYGDMLRSSLGWDEKNAREGDVTEENIQARIRGNTLMAISNREGCFVLATGNKSELAVGYCTLYGDMAGGFAVIADVLKTKAYELVQYINRDAERIPQSTIDKPPSAELSPDQLDQDSLPPYDVLDAILKAYIEQGKGAKEIVGTLGYKADLVDWVIKKVDSNEFKRKQMPPGLKVSPVAFGTGRRMPIVARMPPQ